MVLTPDMPHLLGSVLLIMSQNFHMGTGIQVMGNKTTDQ